MDQDAMMLQFSLVGIGATIVMDLWALTLRLGWDIPALNYAFVGRWIGHMRSGVLFHEQIGNAPLIPYEKSIGWITHYATGVIFALVFGKLTGPDWLAAPLILPAVMFGVLTVIFPFFILQPAFGAGWAASKTPAPMKARFRSLSAHLSFGVGLYVAAIVLTSL